MLHEGITDISYGFRGCSGLTDITIPDSVTSINNAFNGCSSLSHIIVPSSVINLGNYTLKDCVRLKELYFKGNAPLTDWTTFMNVPANMLVYYIPNTTGWGSDFEGFETTPWLPQLEVDNNSQFIIIWAKGLDVVIEARESLSTSAWQPIQTITLSGGRTPFTDPEVPSYSSRFYRIRLP
ncbi:MAG: leucine-rich repeat domain-containing protein [Verrucomicrobia bacterium]|nr:leucine-rich repeat domain-containing protein [Verrucomicrobiota bacterium]